MGFIQTTLKGYCKLFVVWWMENGVVLARYLMHHNAVGGILSPAVCLGLFDEEGLATGFKQIDSHWRWHQMVTLASAVVDLVNRKGKTLQFVTIAGNIVFMLLLLKSVAVDHSFETLDFKTN